MVTFSLGWGKFIWGQCYFPIQEMVYTDNSTVWSAPQVIAVITISGFVLLAFLVYGKDG